MITKVNIDEWAKWNNTIFHDEKDTIIFCMDKKDPRYDETLKGLRENFTDTRILIIIPKDFKKIYRDTVDYIDPPCVIGYSGGHVVDRYPNKHITDLQDMINTLSINFR